MMIKNPFCRTGLALSPVCKKNVNVWEIDLTEKDTASSLHNRNLLYLYSKIIFFSVNIKQPCTVICTVIGLDF
jgi:hypothetical protein